LLLVDVVFLHKLLFDLLDELPFRREDFFLGLLASKSFLFLELFLDLSAAL
jgi:hypothetical protein